VKAVLYMYIGQTADVIIFVCKKASSQRHVEPQSAVTRRAVDRTEGQIHFDTDQKGAAIDCLATSGLQFAA
jgi:hypothetical protein